MAEIEINHTVKEIRESLELTLKYHKKSWMYLYDNPREGKGEWPPFKSKKLRVNGDCFLCEYALERHTKEALDSACNCCPAMPIILSLYDDWVFAVGEDRAELALQILTVKLKPWAEEYEIKI